MTSTNTSTNPLPDPTSSPLKEIDPDSLWFIHGKAYDLRTYATTHPGGSLALESVQGMDCTQFFEAYHFYTDAPRALLRKMTPVEVPAEVLAMRIKHWPQQEEGREEHDQDKIDNISNSNNNSNKSNDDFYGFFHLADGTPDPFWEALRARCGAVCQSPAARRMGWGPYLRNSFLAYLVLPFIYFFAYLHGDLRVAMAGAAVMALVTCLFWSLPHDCAHFSAIDPKWTWLCWFHVLVSSIFTFNLGYWWMDHPRHHMHTNTPADPDLFHFEPFFHLHTRLGKPLNWLSRLQKHLAFRFVVFVVCPSLGVHGYLPLAILLTQSFRGNTTTPALNNRWRIQWIVLVTHFVLFHALVLGLPLWLDLRKEAVAADGATGTTTTIVTVGRRLACLAAFFAIQGLYLSLFAAAAHIGEQRVVTGEEDEEEDSIHLRNKQNSWAQHQVECNMDVHDESPFLACLTGGLTVHIEHHLFPGVAGDKLFALAPIVQEVCDEYGVKRKTMPGYREYWATIHRNLIALASGDRRGMHVRRRGWGGESNNQ